MMKTPFLGKAKIKPVRPDKFFLPSQEKYVRDKSNKRYVLKPRQAGVTLASGVSAVRRHALANHRRDTWVSTLDQMQALLFIEDCKKIAALYSIAAESLGEQIVDPKTRESAFVLRFANGTHIYALSSNPNAQAGKRGHRVLDEFALHPHARQLWAIASPGTTWGGGIDVVSTPRGDKHLFHTFYQEIINGGNPKRFSLHRFTLEDLLKEGYLYKIQQKLSEESPDDLRLEMDEDDYLQYVRDSCADEETFRQEYMCEFSSEEGAFIEYDLIDSATYPHDVKWEEDLDPTRHYALGVDVGRVKDLTVLYLLDIDGSMRKTRRLITMQNTAFAEQERAIGAYLQLPYVRRCCIDQTGIGRQLAETMRTRFGHKVEGVNFTSAVKEDLAITLRRCMEDGYLRIPRDAALISDLRGIRKTTTSAGNVRYEGERNANGHSDRFWALALALHAAHQPNRWTFAPIAC